MKTHLMRWLASCALALTVVGCGGPDPTDPANKLATSSSSLCGEYGEYDEEATGPCEENGGDWDDDSGNGGYDDGYGYNGYSGQVLPIPIPPPPLPVTEPPPQVVVVTAPSNIFCEWFGIFCGGSSEPAPQPPPPEIPFPIPPSEPVTQPAPAPVPPAPAPIPQNGLPDTYSDVDAYNEAAERCAGDHAWSMGSDCPQQYNLYGSEAYWICKEAAGRKLEGCMTDARNRYRINP
ncbi:hypothetical protein HMI49_34185 [Corallococcus exercitus]|uniref:Uncharacterized protein n=1 Tax=Corallococcus exercitus TaxID=2316736 RepID=A0A7Y4KQV9_9BACT|nr:hypothetical protein [Corallococcus exercitus]NOK38260.1 hypothetical protein [Corallococcus exercitus]